MSEQTPQKDLVYRPGVDVEIVPKMLVSAHGLARLFDVDAATIRRWAKRGIMPQPCEVGGRRLWRADQIRAWCDADCPDVNETQK